MSCPNCVCHHQTPPTFWILLLLCESIVAPTLMGHFCKLPSPSGRDNVAIEKHARALIASPPQLQRTYRGREINLVGLLSVTRM
jgi:hypothetical protein